MAYNNGRENRKWLIWKEAEEKILRVRWSSFFVTLMRKKIPAIILVFSFQMVSYIHLRNVGGYVGTPRLTHALLNLFFFTVICKCP